MTNEKKNWIDNILPWAVVMIVVICVLVVLIFVSPFLGYGQLVTNEFTSWCNDLYGKDNWTEYNADFIDFIPGSHQPTYFHEGHIFTCFKNGTVP